MNTNLEMFLTEIDCFNVDIYMKSALGQMRRAHLVGVNMKSAMWRC